MKRKATILFCVCLFPISMVWAQSVNRTELESDFGPPVSEQATGIYFVKVYAGSDLLVSKVVVE